MAQTTAKKTPMTSSENTVVNVPKANKTGVVTLVVIPNISKGSVL